jgi:DNA-binding MarR family transcriptional regulator
VVSSQVAGATEGPPGSIETLRLVGDVSPRLDYSGPSILLEHFAASSAPEVQQVLQRRLLELIAQLTFSGRRGESIQPPHGISQIETAKRTADDAAIGIHRRVNGAEQGCAILCGEQLGTIAAGALRSAEEKTGPMNATAVPGAKYDPSTPGAGGKHGTRTSPADHGTHPVPVADHDTARLFAFFTEIHVIGQLSGRMLESGLPAGFLLSHYSVLDLLACKNDGMTPLALARAFQVPKTTMTHTLSGLEKAGLIRFTPHPKDGRSKCVMLTDEGRHFRDVAIERLTPELALMSEHFSADVIADAADLLARIREYLDKRPAE